MKQITLLLASFILSMGITTAQIKPVIPKDIKKTITVSGTVKNEAGQAVKDAMVSAKGTDIGKTTNANGKFSFQVLASTRTLVVKCTGYFEKEVAAGTNINVVIKKIPAKMIDSLSPRIHGSDLMLNLHIGMPYKGGIIAYLDATKKHGLIAAPYDQNGGAPIHWYNGADTATGANETAIGTGRNNTDRIVMLFGTGNYAAILCKNLVLNGYNDWYLPSKDELNELYKNKDKIGGFSTEKGYWSSTEGSNFQDLTNGFQGYLPHNYLCLVRAVRSF